MNNFKYFTYGILLFSSSLYSQNAKIQGYVKVNGTETENVDVHLDGTSFHTKTNAEGFYEITKIPEGKYTIKANYSDFRDFEKKISLSKDENIIIPITFDDLNKSLNLDDIVVTGTMKAVNRLESSVPVEVYTKAFLKKNPTPSLFDALQNVNGVRPQVNCNVCNTGDIHINGLEGPYTMVLIDGMPMVSSLGTVYGLSGIPNALIERIEIVKGPASSLYGSEAVGGLINVITKKAANADKFTFDVSSSTWQEVNTDLSYKFKIKDEVDVLTGLNYFNFQNKVDNNHDNFTDLTLQNRISVFQKWNFKRANHKLFNLVGRYLYEDRWGGDLRWNKSYRGGDKIYGESIYTNRFEIFGNYQLPLKEKMFLNFSYIQHDQDSRYGETSYIGNQKIAFGQLTWDKKINNHDLLAGAALRYTYYNDNTPATAGTSDNINAKNTWLTGVFVQDELDLNPQNKLLVGLRYDRNNIHGNIFTPRIAYKWAPNKNNLFRLNAGTGFRVVNLFTEDHAALTGARKLVIKNELKPEKSYNINLNYTKKFFLGNGGFLGLESSAFYTYFNNKISPDYETNTNEIIYDNLDGYATSKGISLNADLALANGLRLNLGATLMDNLIYEDGKKEQQILTEKFMGTWLASYTINAWDLNIDYTGNIYGPMRLPLLGELDPRRPMSPWFSIQNIQFTYKGLKNFEIYSGIKNLLNWTPNKGNPFIIARTNDPFDKNVKFDSNGAAIATPDNPYALTFDPAYVYASNQGIRGFLGIRYNFN